MRAHRAGKYAGGKPRLQASKFCERALVSGGPSPRLEATVSLPTDFIVEPDVVLLNLRATSGEVPVCARPGRRGATRLEPARDETDFRAALMDGLITV
jgi:hypothetical protein